MSKIRSKGSKGSCWPAIVTSVVVGHDRRRGDLTSIIESSRRDVGLAREKHGEMEELDTNSPTLKPRAETDRGRRGARDGGRWLLQEFGDSV
jgi:hypothetical protein